MRSEKGFTLVEMAVVLVIAGLVMGGAMVLMKPFVQNAQINTTKIRLENIANSLALYAQTYGRLPCPADENPPGAIPFGAPRNSVDGTRTDRDCGAGTPQAHIGIVPFRALGLSEDNAKDAYGNFVTYAVAPVLALQGTAAQRDTVHAYCRRTSWIDPISTSNINPAKARLCCARFINAASEITVNDNRTAGATIFSGLHHNGVNPAPNPYDDMDNVSTNANADTRFIAFVLNSTGQNGEQALVRTPDTRKPIRIAGTQETENNDYDDFIFVSRPRSMSEDNNYFDDVILWRTNDQLVSNFGNDSCNKP